MGFPDRVGQLIGIDYSVMFSASQGAHHDLLSHCKKYSRTVGEECVEQAVEWDEVKL